MTFEGPEGAGKSTAIAFVAEKLREEGLDVVTTREPGAGPLGAKIRELLLHGLEITPKTELLLFLADRSNHVATVIRPALAANQTVICDRYIDSTLVYQGMARGLDKEFVEAANRFATSDLIPDLTLLLDVPAEIGLGRVRNPDRLDKQPLEFHHAVRSGFLQLAGQDPARWIVLDATREFREVAGDALGAIRLKMGKQ